MSKFDETFKKNIMQILDTPEWIPSRAMWEDQGVYAATKHIFGLINRYDLREEMPVGTLRKLYIRNCIDEILWIYQKKSNNVKDLSSSIWNSWADLNGSIGAAYGFQVANKLQIEYSTIYNDDGSKTSAPMFLDQMDSVIWKLKNTPFDRRIMIMLYDINANQLMALPPCCYSCTFNVTVDSYDNKVLNMLLNQRSQDMIVANNWNVFQYAILLKMIAHECNMVAGELVHVIADAHIYDRHENVANELLDRLSYPAPILKMQTMKDDGMRKSFYDFTIDDFILSDYKHGSTIKNIPVAV